MNKELWCVFIPPISALLGALGGTEISTTINGQKWIRRFLLPAVWCVCVWICASWWQGLMVGGIGILAACMGYGSSHDWNDRILAAIMYGAISFPLGITAWSFMAMAVLPAMFLLSNWQKTADIFTWKICEATIWFVVGLSVAYPLAMI